LGRYCFKVPLSQFVKIGALELKPLQAFDIASSKSKSKSEHVVVTS
jgi:hypothetical protein